MASAYEIAQDLDPHRSRTQDWRWIWRAKCPPRIQTFLWLCSHNRLPCAETLVKRSLDLNPVVIVPWMLNQLAIFLWIVQPPNPSGPLSAVLQPKPIPSPSLSYIGSVLIAKQPNPTPYPSHGQSFLLMLYGVFGLIGIAESLGVSLSMALSLYVVLDLSPIGEIRTLDVW
ncbi:hypothetical protein CRG98_009491 [Punica granatum]|uniref:Reverse transcriptase zinc-binding domain-containing protein n=1 Tax=Punica granatum TaxID=22663 RepID=A0A2I0KNV1_PUNGR|nr:hypothetical protein CRG98_009491 [Punica granatum]